MFHGVRRSIRHTVIATAMGAALGAGCVVVVVGAAISVVDHPTHPVPTKERQATAADAKAVAPATPATAPTAVEQSGCSHEAWPPCPMRSAKAGDANQNLAATAVPYLAGSVNTASYEQSNVGGPAATNAGPQASAPVAPEQETTAAQSNKDAVAALPAHDDAAPAYREQIRELAPPRSNASGYRSRRSDRYHRGRYRSHSAPTLETAAPADRDPGAVNERFDPRQARHQWRHDRRRDNTIRVDRDNVGRGDNTDEQPASADSQDHATDSSDRATAERGSADNSGRYSRRQSRRSREVAPTPATAPDAPATEPDYAAHQGDGVGLFGWH
jgi:hypothetical protein